MKRKRNQKISKFTSDVLRVVSRIPRGYVLTYGEVASRSGNPKACRAVGTIMRKNYNPKIPCHRVIAQDGLVGGYNRGRRRKILLLRREGLVIKKGSLRQKKSHAVV
ncbi:MAG: MGMT family protein [Candidatus Ryanbacteria bacterium]|nr:MGMT family protein [Candidatus Ryanbacteria bacterium]